MSLFGATLEATTLQPIPELGAAVYVSSSANATSAVLAPTIGTGASVAPNTANSRAEQWVPVIVAGVAVQPGTANAIGAAVAPTAVVTSAHVTLAASVDAISTALAPAVAAGQSVTPPVVDTTANSLAPVVVAGVNVQPGTTANAAAAVAPNVYSGGAVAFSDPVDNISVALVPALIGAGTTVFPVVQTLLALDDSVGSFGSTLEFSTLEGAVTSRSIVREFTNRTATLVPAIATGKNVILLAPADAVSQARVPDIETERRRRMVQAIAA